MEMLGFGNRIESGNAFEAKFHIVVQSIIYTTQTSDYSISFLINVKCVSYQHYYGVCYYCVYISTCALAHLSNQWVS